MADLNEIGQFPDGMKNDESKPDGIGLFFGDKERAFFSSAGREMTESILQESMMLFRMDLKRTQTHSLYGEAKSFQKSWKPEVKILGRINVESVEPEFAAEGGLVKKGFGQLTAHVYMEHLEEMDIVKYEQNQIVVFDLNDGDFIGFKDQFYKIINNGHSQISNEFSWGGDRRFYITVSAVEVDEDVFKAR
jgi:hypothetical protein